MKKTLLFVAIIVSLFSCVSDNLDGAELVFSEETVVFKGSETKSLYISTNPKSDCDYQITSMPSWVKADRKSGNLNASNGINEIILTSDLTNLQPGTYEGNLEFTTTLGNKTILLQAIVGDNLTYTVPKTLNFSISDNEVKFTIKNNGNVPLSYTIDNQNTKTTLSSNSGTIEVRGQKEIAVTINRDGFPNGLTSFNLNLKINNSAETIAVTVDNFKELKSMVVGDVMDAEYSKVKDQLVFVSANPSKLSIYNPSTSSMETVPLVYTPTCVSVSQDGETAVVGHDGHITYINLKTKSIIKTYSSSCFALDIVLGNNKWAYVFPKENQWTYIRCINMNLSNDNETYSTGGSIYAGTKGRLHPSGKYIYGADNGLSPSDIEKYDIQNGVANMLYDSPYHGDYPMSGNLWFTEDGNRIFTRGKTVLKTSDIKTSDMIYNGSITADSNIEWLNHSAAKDNLFVIINSGNVWQNERLPYIYTYNAINLNFKNKLELEKYQVQNTTGGFNYFDAEPHFVFSNSSGNVIYVLTKAKGSGLVNEWAIQKMLVQ
ncbi:BACON domain-containing protein [Flavobacterium algicola]|uniref:BACON domain-containing protein n=1 Tax=Flavobacterium algicola TaxID=556529 RepID=UPI001EFCF011|nr:hypothetical protein [Flavobacterium algicola]MCG9794097.1 hypothetical protein [Flavobacterium algicola]